MQLISDGYRELNREMHELRAGYGSAGHHWLGHVLEILEDGGYTTVLDYGCGKATLGRYLWRFGVDYRGYDPAVERYAAPPEPAELVVCLDVLEHIEPGCLDTVLDHLRQLTIGEIFFVVSLRLANKSLTDGRNAHLIVEPHEWWRERIETRFEPFWTRIVPDHHFSMRALAR